jgi:asparagine synthase (glutamine-hydrolysing)
MCGIAGVINSELDRRELEKVLRKMMQSLHHRGPDDQGYFISKDETAGLVSTRLSILDLSSAGHQPMRSDDERYTITFNGEIYNYASLRAELQELGEQFKSDSDTEVVLRMYARYGPACVREFAGMFAFAIWDEIDQSCFLARGPLGIKPIYIYEKEGALFFASELRTLLDSGLFSGELECSAVAGYLLYGAVPEPLTLAKNVRALPAGHYLICKAGQSQRKKYWDIQFSDDWRTNATEAVRSALVDSVRRHLVSDVPLGVFLSGGIDSTTIVALAAKEISNLRTFCISFEQPEFDEGTVAAKTAKHFGTEHSDWRLDSTTAKGLLNSFLEASDQPSIDGFNTYCIAKLAHDSGLKVVLSGLGGDEIFGGYRSFDLVPRIVRASRLLNPLFPLRQAGGILLQSLAQASPIRRLGKFLTGSPAISLAYWSMRGIFSPEEVIRLLPRYCGENDGEVPVDFHVPSQPTLQDEVSYLELTRYMRNQLLRDSDVMSMAWNLELRVPFVDRHLIETVERIPASLRLRTGKQIMLDAIPEIPDWVRNRPKKGFVFPFRDWITGEWQDIFQRIEANSPVQLRSWYRCWCLFALESFLARNKIEAIGITTKFA